MERFGPTRRGGPVFRWLGEDLSIDLANTVMIVREGGEAVDLLADETQMQRWLESERERLGGVELGLGAEDFTRLCELRDAVRDLFTASAKGEPLPVAALECVNAASAQDPYSPRLCIREDGVAEVRESSGAGVDGLLGTSARAAIQLLGEPGGAKLHLCTAPSCGMFFIGKRRWCCAACGNRARAARHYSRQHGARRGPRGRREASETPR
jgi:predicted RNA-binding Zn ribbon-like protein